VEVSQRALIALVVLTLVLVVGAVLLSVDMSQPADQAEAPANPAQTSQVVPHVTRIGGDPGASQGTLEIKAEKGSSPKSALLSCDVFKSERPFQPNGTVIFPAVPVGECGVVLDGSGVAYTPVFAGDKLVCLRDEDTTRCTGGTAQTRAATVSVTSTLPGTLWVDDQDMGQVPLSEKRINVGRHELRLVFESGQETRWTLLVKPDEKINLHFPEPGSQEAEQIRLTSLPQGTVEQ
jgi:hypothetical protein